MLGSFVSANWGMSCSALKQTILNMESMSFAGERGTLTIEFSISFMAEFSRFYRTHSLRKAKLRLETYRSQSSGKDYSKKIQTNTLTLEFYPNEAKSHN